VYDPRLVQTPPVYGVQKGALSISTSPFSALSANSTQHTYQILVPSLNVFVDRKIVWNTGVYIRSAVCPTIAGDAGFLSAIGSSASIDIIQGCDPRTEQYRRTLFAHQLGPVPVSSTAPASSLYPQYPGDYYEFVCPGTNFNLSPFPLQTLCNNMTCSINDCSVVTNGDTLQEQILLSNTRMTQRIRTTPSKFDQYAWTQDDVLSGNGNMSSFTNAKSAVGEIPTGAWPIAFQNPQTGVQLGQFGSYVDPINQHNVYFINGRPVLVPGGVPAISQTVVLQVAPATGPGNGSFTIASSGGIISPSNQNAQTFVMNIPNQAGFTYWPGLPPIVGSTSGSSNQPVVFMIDVFGLTNVHLLATNVVCTAGALAVTFQVAQLNTAGVLSYPSVWTGSNNTATGSTAFNGTGIAAASSVGCVIRLPGPQQILSTLLGQVTPDGVLIQATECNVPTEISFQYTVAEPIVMSPFIWQDPLELNTVGLYGCTNIQFVMNLQAPSPACQVVAATVPLNSYTPYWQARLGCDYPSGGNLIRCSGITGAFSNVRLIPPNNTASTYGPFTSPRLLVQFLTPGPDISLPLISNVPYTEFPRYFKQDSLSTPTSIQNTVASQTITLSSIPDVLMVFVKSRKRSQMQNETYYPIRGVQITFDNFSNLCANMTQDQLYQASVEAGLDMDWHTWRGYTNSTTSVLQGGNLGSAFAAQGQVAITGTPLLFQNIGLPYPIASSMYNTAGTYAPIDISSDANSVWAPSYGASAGGLNKFSPKRATQLTGGPLMLRMGQDISLSPGLAPGTLGNFSLQVNLVLDNQYGFFDAYPDFQMTIIAVNSGYLETVRGQSAVRKTILNMADVEAAHADSGLTTTSLRRLVGGAMPSLAHLGNFASKLANQIGGPALGNLAKRMRPGSGL